MKIHRHQYREYVVRRESERERENFHLLFQIFPSKLDLYFLLSFTVDVLNGTLFLKKIRWETRWKIQHEETHDEIIYGANFLFFFSKREKIRETELKM